MKISLKGLIGGIAAVLIGVAAVAGLAAPLTFGGSEPFGRSFYETGFDALLFRSETVYRGLALSKTPLILVGLIVVAQIVCGAAGIVCGVLSVLTAQGFARFDNCLRRAFGNVRGGRSVL